MTTWNYWTQGIITRSEKASMLSETIIMEFMSDARVSDNGIIYNIFNPTTDLFHDVNSDKHLPSYPRPLALLINQQFSMNHSTDEQTPYISWSFMTKTPVRISINENKRLIGLMIDGVTIMNTIKYNDLPKSIGADEMLFIPIQPRPNTTKDEEETKVNDKEVILHGRKIVV